MGEQRSDPPVHTEPFDAFGTDEGSARLEQTAPLIEAGVEVDHFRVVRMIGQGGMGEVYLARDTQLGRKVALKVIHPRRMGTPEAAQRFLAEARTTARFSHPHIVTVYAVGQWQDNPYVALEYLEGQTLRERMVEARLSLREAMRCGLAVAEALAEAHRRRILHRDLKPENVIIPWDGRLRVLDFGLAKQLRGDAPAVAGGGGAVSLSTDTMDPVELLDPTETEERKLCGTPAYMAPEQWRGEDSTEATDVWALGVLLHEMLVGRRPYHREEGNQIALAWQVAGGDPVPLATSLLEGPPELAELVRRCQDKDPSRRPTAAEAVGVLHKLLHPGQDRFGEQESPFRGLRPFTERHADVFFGRDAEIAAFLELAREEPVLPVVGPSGAGKSSFVQAGVIPRLREQGPWRVLSLRPGSDPFLALAGRLLQGESSTAGPSSSRSAFRSAALQDQATVEHPDASGPRSQGDDEPSSPRASLWSRVESTLQEETQQLVQRELQLAEELEEAPHLLALHLQQLAERESSRVLLLVDQLEELYALVDDDGVRARFMAALCTAADDHLGPVRVIFTVRDDFLGRLAVGPEVRRALSRVTVIRSPGADALEEILTRPLQLAGFEYDDPALVAEMIAEVQGEAAGLPLLQFAVRTLWDRRDKGRRRLRREDYAAMGGVAGALAEHAEGVLQGLSHDQVRLAREILLRLVTPDGTRRVLTTARVLEGLDPGAVEVLTRLTQHRLISVRKGRHGGDAGGELELVHESLVRGWRQLALWIDESREELAFLDEIGQAAELWEKRGRRAEEAWSGDALVDARRLIDRTTTQVPELVVEFLEACEAKHQRAVGRRRLMWSTIVGGLALVALASVVVAVMLADRERAAQEARRDAEIARAQGDREGAREALARGDVLESRAKLRRSVETVDSPLSRALWAELQGEPLRWEKTLGSVANDVAFSPDGGTLAAACGDMSIYLIDAETTEMRILRGHRDQVYALDFSPDGRLLASGTAQGALRLWNLDSGEVRVLSGHEGAINYLDFSDDGRWMATGSSDGTIRVWDVAGDAPPRVLEDHGDAVHGVAFSPDGRWLASGGRGGKLVLHDTATWKARAVPNTHGGTINNVAFHPDGALLATASVDQTVHLFDVERGTEQEVVRGNGARLWDVAFSPDGRWLAAVGWDRLLHLHDLSGEGPARELAGHRLGIYAVTWSPDGRRVATSSADKTVRLWDLAATPAEPVSHGHDAQAHGGVFSADGQRVMTGGQDKLVHIWDVASGTEAKVIGGLDISMQRMAFRPGTDEAVVASWDGQLAMVDLVDGTHEQLTTGVGVDYGDIDFDPSGTLLATGTMNRMLEVWDLTSWTRVFLVEAHNSALYGVVFHPDGALLASAGSDRTIGLWDVRSGALVRRLVGHTDAVRDVAFSPDGAILASTGHDGTVRIWDWEAGTSWVLGEFDGRGYTIQVHPDGRRVGVACSDNVGRIYHLETRECVELRGHRSEVNHLGFSPDGTLAATSSDDHTVRVWEVDSGRPYWRTSIFLTDPPELHTHVGWQRLDGGAPAIGSGATKLPAWRGAVSRYAAKAARSADGDTLCLATHDGRVEIWDVSDDERLLDQQGASPAEVLATGAGCVTLGTDGARLYDRAGAVQVLGAGATAVAEDGDRLLVAVAEKISVLSATGEWQRDVWVGAGVSAVTRIGDDLVVGFADGSIEQVPLQREGRDVGRRLTPFEDTPSSPVVAIEEGPPGTLVLGFGNGHLGLWNRDNGEQLTDVQLHGPVVHVALQDGELYAATDLGDHHVIDLGVYYRDRCELLREVWDGVPVVWQAGLPVPASTPTDHECSR